MSNKRTLYRLGRLVLGPLFKWYYNPQIDGIENIGDGSLIIAGNHIHLYDECSAIISTKRLITYMAKKEYFDSKKTAWFVKGVGCIPVNRSKKDTEATKRAIEVLNSGGIIGIYPEGTRNNFKREKIKEYHDKYFKEMKLRKFSKLVKKIRYSKILFLESLLLDKKINKEEFICNFFDVDNFLIRLEKDKIITRKDRLKADYLPFKYGAVSMAYKTKAKIVPVLVTGEYQFRSKNLHIRFGKPFEVLSNDLDYYNDKLLNEFIKLSGK